MNTFLKEKQMILGPISLILEIWIIWIIGYKVLPNNWIDCWYGFPLTTTFLGVIIGTLFLWGQLDNRRGEWPK